MFYGFRMGLFRGTSDCKFTPEDDSKFIGEQLWSILKAIIMTNIENNQHLIVEGCYLLPDKIKEFDDEYIKNIISFYIGFSKNYIEKNYVSGIVAHCNVIETRDDDAVDPVNQLISEHLEQKAVCNAYNAKFFEINENYIIEMKDIYKWIDNEIIKLKKNIIG